MRSTQQQWPIRTVNTSTLRQRRVQRHTMVTRLQIISRTNMVKPVEVCLLHYAVIVNSDNKTHSAKG